MREDNEVKVQEQRQHEGQQKNKKRSQDTELTDPHSSATPTPEGCLLTSQDYLTHSLGGRRGEQTGRRASREGKKQRNGGIKPGN